MARWSDDPDARGIEGPQFLDRPTGHTAPDDDDPGGSGHRRQHLPHGCDGGGVSLPGHHDDVDVSRGDLAAHRPTRPLVPPGLSIDPGADGARTCQAPACSHGSYDMGISVAPPQFALGRCGRLCGVGGMVPVVISVDVEPAGFQLTSDAAVSTAGYDAMVEVITRLRPALEQTTGRRASFGWFFRMDPQIDAVFGRPDHLVDGFGNRVGGLLDAGDHVGLHTHLVRWSATQDSWVHDVSDSVWIRDALESSFAAFAQCFGQACERHRAGAAIYSQDMVDSLASVGAKVDSSLEPVRGRGVDEDEILGSFDATPLSGRNTDCTNAPRRPYHPAPGDFIRPSRQPRSLVLLPMTTSWLMPNRPGWQTLAGAVLKRRQRPRRRVLYPADLRVAPGPAGEYWDLVARQLGLMRRPYLNIAIRTDSPDSPQFLRASSVLAALPHHPLAQRLSVVDPLSALPGLLGETAALDSSASL